MAFVVEDGTGLANSNSYESVANSLIYHADRGNVAWAALSEDEQKAALIRASDYADKRFGRRFRGYRRSKSQAKEWPRLDAFDDDDFLLNGIDDDLPRQLIKAVNEYALRASTSVLAPDNVDTGLNSLKEKVGPIETEKTRSGSKTASGSSLVSAESIPDYPEADLWMEELLKPSGSRTLRRG